MFINVINSYRYVVAICDEDLVGKIFEEENIQLNVKENFYKSKENPISKTKEEVIEIIKRMAIEDATFNIVGKESIQTSLEVGIINKNQVREIKGIPYSMVLL